MGEQQVYLVGTIKTAYCSLCTSSTCSLKFYYYYYSTHYRKGINFQKFKKSVIDIYSRHPEYDYHLAAIKNCAGCDWGFFGIWLVVVILVGYCQAA